MPFSSLRFLLVVFRATERTEVFGHAFHSGYENFDYEPMNNKAKTMGSPGGKETDRET